MRLPVQKGTGTKLSNISVRVAGYALSSARPRHSGLMKGSRLRFFIRKGVSVAGFASCAVLIWLSLLPKQEKKNEAAFVR